MKAHKLHKFSTAKTLDRFYSILKSSMRNKISLVKSLTDMSLKDRVNWYASHSAKETSGKHIFVPSLACYMSDPMAAGNSKLDKSILIFDLLAVTTCRNCRSCAASCYALKAQRMYANTLLKRSLNTWLAMQDLDFLFQCIENQIRNSRKTVVRIHSSGDFFAQIYINKWAELIAKFPNIRFYAYTKVDHIFDFSKIENLENFNLIRSILPDGSKNYGPEEEIKAKARKFNFPVCPYRKGMNAENMPHCGGTCEICLNSPIVGFVEH